MRSLRERMEHEWWVLTVGGFWGPAWKLILSGAGLIVLDLVTLRRWRTRR